jgi:hypothetical protein
MVTLFFGYILKPLQIVRVFFYQQGQIRLSSGNSLNFYDLMAVVKF